MRVPLAPAAAPSGFRSRPASAPGPVPHKPALAPTAEPSSAAILWLFWIYVGLVIFEGSLRKWVLPSLSNELLFAREPILILIYALALKDGLFPIRPVVMALAGMAIATSLIGLVMNPGNLLVTVFGLKANFLHLPLIFVIGRALSANQVVALGKAIMICGILMLPVMVMQFRSSSSDFWNFGPGGVPDAQITGALGKVRPPGFFSFISGVAQFCALNAAFIVYGVLNPKKYSRKLVLAAGVALILSVALSISRTTLGSVATVLVMIVVLVMVNRKFAGQAIYGLAVVGAVVFVVSSFDLFKEGSRAMESRLSSTGDMERGLIGTSVSWSERIIGDLQDGLRASQSAPLFGKGIGFGTNVGAKLLTGRLQFLGFEGEWGRVIMEMGAIFGFAYLALRVGLVVSLLRGALNAARADNALSLLIFGACCWPLFNGQFGQTTTVGFAVIGGAFCLAAQNQGVASAAPLTEAPVSKTVKSRSQYAETILRGQNR